MGHRIYHREQKGVHSLPEGLTYAWNHQHFNIQDMLRGQNQAIWGRYPILSAFCANFALSVIACHKPSFGPSPPIIHVPPWTLLLPLGISIWEVDRKNCRKSLIMAWSVGRFLVKEIYAEMYLGDTSRQILHAFRAEITLNAAHQSYRLGSSFPKPGPKKPMHKTKAMCIVLDDAVRGKVEEIAGCSLLWVPSLKSGICSTITYHPWSPKSPPTGDAFISFISSKPTEVYFVGEISVIFELPPTCSADTALTIALLIQCFKEAPKHLVTPFGKR